MKNVLVCLRVRNRKRNRKKREMTVVGWNLYTFCSAVVRLWPVRIREERTEGEMSRGNSGRGMGIAEDRGTGKRKQTNTKKQFNER